MNRFRNHCLLRAGSLRLVITYFDPLGVGLLFVFFAVLFLILGSKGSGDFAVEGGKFGFEGFKFVFFAPCARQDGFEGRHIDTFLSARSRCWLIVSGSFSRALTKFMQAAWAITIHKSQGLTFEHAIIDASHSFAHGQTYVALSRCKSLEGMVLGAPLGREAVISDGTVSEFIRKAEANRPTADTLSRLERAYVVQILDELFSFTMLRQAAEMVTRTLTDHFYNKHQTLLTEYTAMQNTLTELAGVASKFGEQYRCLLDTNPDTAHPLLQERVHKAAGYFAGRLESMKTLFAKTRVDTGNKLVADRFADRRAALGDELDLKTKLFEYEGDTETVFATGDYLRRKAQILLGDEMEDTAAKGRARKTKPTKAPKEPKVPTAKISYDMFISGMAVDRIAAERRLTPGTVFNHLAQYVERGLCR